MKNLKFDALPGIPKPWLDFIDGRHPQLAPATVPAVLGSLGACRREIPGRFPPREARLRALLGDAASARARDLVRRLAHPESVAVVAGIGPDLFGGPLAQFFKCLTAAQVRDALVNHSIDAVAVVWIRPPSGGDAAEDRSFRILDPERRPHRFRVPPGPGADRDGRIRERIPDLVAAVSDIGGGSFDPEILGLMRSAYAPGGRGPSPGARWLEDLLEAWDVLVVDSRSAGLREFWENAKPDMPGALAGSDPSGFCMQRLLLPVAACVLDCDDLQPFAETRTCLDALGVSLPLTCPAISATLVDADSRRTLQRYRLDLRDLFDGEAALLGRLEGPLPGRSIGRALDGLERDFRRRLEALVPAPPGGGAVHEAWDDCRERVVFQLRKIRRRAESAASSRRKVLRRRLRRACSSLAPGGGVQQRRLAGIYFLLRHSRALLPSLYDGLDWGTLEHQSMEIP